MRGENAPKKPTPNDFSFSRKFGRYLLNTRTATAAVACRLNYSSGDSAYGRRMAISLMREVGIEVRYMRKKRKTTDRPRASVRMLTLFYIVY